MNARQMRSALKPGFHKANFDFDNDQFLVETKRLVGRMTAQSHNLFVFWVVVVEFAVNGTMHKWYWLKSLYLIKQCLIQVVNRE